MDNQRVPTSKKDYSDFISYLSDLSEVLSLFCGFTFTAITILMTLLPDPSSFLSQLTLLLLAVLFDVFLLLLTWATMTLMQFCEYVPFDLIPYSRFFNWLFIIGIELWGVAVVLMFLLWNLIYLALAQGIIWASISIAAYPLFVKSFFELYRKTVSS